MNNLSYGKLLEGKSALITGAGSGIGKAILERFIEAGAVCVAADINFESVKALNETYGNSVHPLKIDVSSREEVENAINLTVEKFGKMDIIVNNAGILDNLTPIDEMEDELWDKIMAVNLNSVMYGTRKAVRYFMENKIKGVILNTASLSSLFAGRGGTAYTASKFAVAGLTKNVAFMYGDEGIRCNAICPGNTTTNIGATMRPSKRGLAKATTGYSGALRAGTSEEVAASALFMCSEESSFINGQTITIDGGWSAY